MPPRIPSPLRSVGQWLCRVPQVQSQAEISSTSPAAAFKDLTNNQSNLLNLDTPSAATSDQPRSHDALSKIIKSTAARRAANSAVRQQTTKEELRSRTVHDQYARQAPRHWQAGDVYAPHDLSPQEMRKYTKWKPPKRDVLDLLGVNPLDMYKNFSLISDFITPFGRIKHSRESGLRPVNQRRMAKTIRRAIGLGIHPSVYRHPMILLKEGQNSDGRLG